MKIIWIFILNCEPNYQEKTYIVLFIIHQQIIIIIIIFGPNFNVSRSEGNTDVTRYNKYHWMEAQ